MTRPRRAIRLDGLVPVEAPAERPTPRPPVSLSAADGCVLSTVEDRITVSVHFDYSHGQLYRAQYVHPDGQLVTVGAYATSPELARASLRASAGQPVVLVTGFDEQGRRYSANGFGVADARQALSNLMNGGYGHHHADQ